MSDQEHIDVTTTEDQSEPPSLTKSPISKCGYCDCEKDGLPVFHCHSCNRWVHTSCLRSGSPSPILFDNYYIFKCTTCSEDDKESFTRMRITWNQATTLALFNIAQAGPGRQGFYKWKEAVGGFIEKHWDLLFENYRKKTNTWINTIAATMSAGNPHQFTSGYGFFKESGWWKLTDPTKPPEYTPPSHDPKAKEVKPKKIKSYLTSTPSGSAGKLEGLRKRPYHSSAYNASQLKEKRSRTQENLEIRTIEFLKDACSLSPDGISKDSNERHVKNEASLIKTPPSKALTKEPEENELTAGASADTEDSPPSFKGCGSPISSPLSSPRSLSATSMLSKGDLAPDNTLPLAALSDDSDNDGVETSKEGRPPSPDKYFTPLAANCSATVTPQPVAARLSSTIHEHSASLPKFASNDRATSAFSAIRKKRCFKVTTNGNETDHPITPRLQEMNLYQEKALLKKLESYGALLKEVPAAYRLRRKLLVRQKKRELNIPITSFDATVKRLLAQQKGEKLPDPKQLYDVHHRLPIISSSARSKHHSVLDRFQSPLPVLNERTSSGRTFRQKLVGCDEDETPPSIISPYTQRVLKPYIRRDYESKPLKLAVMEQIVMHGDCKRPLSSPIDYSYVRPHHIPTINALCHHFFWPGIDLTETLQYPDFSIVALYKKMVIGFGFMVPDVGFNEAYISFLLVHPDWRHAGIGTFMVYHLIQTCMGKDVTLHVSASNSAMLLYQKFGFKPEQFISDFYDKYHAVDSSECKHAFFMRLRR